MQISGGNPSFLDRVLDHLVRQPQQPSAPEPPKVDQGAWAKSVDQARVSDNLSVRDLGLIVFNESQSYSNRPDSNESIDTAREKMAHAIINADQTCGDKRQRMAKAALPVEPSAKALTDTAVRTAYDSSMKAAREAYLSGTDPTDGAVFLNQRQTADRSNRIFPGGFPGGVPLRTQSGPYNNTFPNAKLPSRTGYLNTYGHK